MIPLITTADLVEFQVLARSENIPPKSEAHPLPLLVRISALFPDILSVLCWSLSSTNRFGICNYFFQDLVFDVDWRAQMTLQSRRREGRGTKHNRKVFFILFSVVDNLHRGMNHLKGSCSLVETCCCALLCERHLYYSLQKFLISAFCAFLELFFTGWRPVFLPFFTW